MKCNTCDTEFVDMTGHDQGNGCAASLYLHNGTHYILAHYGSRFDMQRYALKRGQYKTGNICDECIDKYIKNGNAHLIEDGVW